MVMSFVSFEGTNNIWSVSVQTRLSWVMNLWLQNRVALLKQAKVPVSLYATLLSNTVKEMKQKLLPEIEKYFKDVANARGNKHPCLTVEAITGKMVNL